MNNEREMALWNVNKFQNLLQEFLDFMQTYDSGENEEKNNKYRAYLKELAKRWSKVDWLHSAFKKRNPDLLRFLEILEEINSQDT